MKLLLKLSLCICLIIGLSLSSYAQHQKVATTSNIITGKIVDNENIFSKAEIIQLESEIQNFIKTANVPMSIIVIPNKSSINNQWTIGTINNPKGILIKLSKSSKEISIGVGKELSRNLTKAKVDDILNTLVLSEFNKGKYKIGISNSIEALLMKMVN